MIRLHGFAESGPCYKVALMLALTGQAWQVCQVNPFAGDSGWDGVRALTPFGEVPVLECEGRVLTQSAVILDDLAERAQRFVGPRAEVMAWMLYDNERLSGVIGPLRFAMNFMPEARRDPAVISWLSKRLRAALKVLDGRLHDRDWLVGDRPTIADLSACGYLFHPEPYTFEREAYPAIDAWLSRISALPGWKHPYDLLPRIFEDGV